MLNVLQSAYYTSGGVIALISIIACAFIAFSKTGRVEVTGNGKKWDTVSWICGIFIAGMGVGLLKASGDLLCYEGMNQFTANMLEGILGYNGIPVWSMYALLAYWYSRHMESTIGKVAAMLSTVIGMAISLKSGIQALVPWITKVAPTGGSASWAPSYKAIGFTISAIMCIVAVLSARNNWLKKISKSATFLFIVSCFIMVIMPSSAWPWANATASESSSEFFKFFFNASGKYDGWGASWWFWWVAWAPTVARWIAKISVGRSTKSMVLASTLLPTAICAVWIFISSNHTEYISGLSLFSKEHMIVTLLLVIVGILFMAGTLDSDCKIFTEDLEDISKGKLKQKDTMPVYGLFVMLFFTAWLNEAFVAANLWFTNYMNICVIFIPMFVIAVIDIVRENRGKELLKIK